MRDTHAQTLAIVGPTASGKSSVAQAVARRTGAVIINCDSVQVYRGFEVGCAKATAAERREVEHQLLDMVDWHEDFDAQRYREAAMGVLAQARVAGRSVVVCGGTGLYLRALRWGLASLPGADPGLRDRLLAEERRTPGFLHASLLRVDPVSAAEIHPHNHVRTLRALEIEALTGQPASVWRRAHGFRDEQVSMRLVFLQWPVSLLRQRIVARTHRILETGLLEETERLLEEGVDPACRPMRSVGYLEAVKVTLGQASPEALATRIVQSTTAYARRQRTWFRRERDLDIRPLSEEADLSELADVLSTDLRAD